jgi:hypothetical protein
MKKLFVLFVGFAALLTATTTTFAQSKDLSGSWVLDVEKSGKKEGPPMVAITLSAAEFVAKVGSEKAPPLTFKLDGTETPAEKGGKTKAAWNGNKLDATFISKDGNAETITFSRDGAWLVMEGQSKERGPMKFYFKKADGKL